MGERGDLLALGALRLPAGLERGGERGAHGVHRREDVVHLAHVGTAHREVEPLLPHALGSLDERRHLARDDAARATCDERETGGAAQGADGEHEVLRVGEGARQVVGDPLRQVLRDERARAPLRERERGVGEAPAPALDRHVTGICRERGARRLDGGIEARPLEVGSRDDAVGADDHVAVRRGDVLPAEVPLLGEPRADLGRVRGAPARLVHPSHVDGGGEEQERHDPGERDGRERIGEVACYHEGEGHAAALLARPSGP